MVRLLHIEIACQGREAQVQILDKRFLYVNFSLWDLRPSLERVAQKWLPVLRKTTRLNKILERFIKFTKKKNALGGAS